MICFQNSGNVENHHLNYRCQFCTQRDRTIFKNWTSKAVYHKACVKYAILHVTAASQQRVIISIMTENIMYIHKISRYVLLSYCTCCVSCKIATRQNILGTNSKNSKASSEVSRFASGTNINNYKYFGKKLGLGGFSPVSLHNVRNEI